MKQLRTVSKTERVIFPIMVTIIVSLIVPDAPFWADADAGN
jgi:Na+-transporting methylmalonyl-CoA/oxaloacetate decarboxylase, beta subunit